MPILSTVDPIGVPTQPVPLLGADPENKQLAKQLLAGLSPERAVDWNKWPQIVWAINTVFAGSQEGMNIAQAFSSTAPICSQRDTVI